MNHQNFKLGHYQKELIPPVAPAVRKLPTEPRQLGCGRADAPVRQRLATDGTQSKPASTSH
jgi:hypothetical protein